MDQAVEDRVRHGGIADDFVPAFQRNLAGDDDRPLLMAVVNDLQQIPALLGSQRLWPPVIEDQQVGPGC